MSQRAGTLLQAWLRRSTTGHDKAPELIWSLCSSRTQNRYLRNTAAAQELWQPLCHTRWTRCATSEAYGGDWRLMYRCAPCAAPPQISPSSSPARRTPGSASRIESLLLSLENSYLPLCVDIAEVRHSALMPIDNSICRNYPPETKPIVLPSLAFPVGHI